MDHPFVAVDANVSHWPHPALFVTTHFDRQFNSSEPDFRSGARRN